MFCHSPIQQIIASTFARRCFFRFGLFISVADREWEVLVAYERCQKWHFSPYFTGCVSRLCISALMSNNGNCSWKPSRQMTLPLLQCKIDVPWWDFYTTSQKLPLIWPKVKILTFLAQTLSICFHVKETTVSFFVLLSCKPSSYRKWLTKGWIGTNYRRLLELDVFGLRVGLFPLPVISPIIPNVRVPWNSYSRSFKFLITACGKV